jgi:hypothetical protein
MRNITANRINTPKVILISRTNFENDVNKSIKGCSKIKSIRRFSTKKPFFRKLKIHPPKTGNKSNIYS